MEENNLNLDALPSRTTGRFNVLVLLGLYLGYFTSSYYTNYLTGKSSSDIEDVAWGLIGIATIIFLATVIFLLTPQIIIWKRKLVKPNCIRHQVAFECIERLAKLLSIPAPSLYISPNLKAQGAQVFGIGIKKYIAIDEGLLRLLQKKPYYFDAVILHELGHIINRDVFKAYMSRSILWGSVLFISPICILRVIQFIQSLMAIDYSSFNGLGFESILFWIFENILIFFQNILPFVPALLFLNFEWAILICDREHYADWRASCAGGFQTLVEIFELQSARQNYSKIKNALTLRFHPLPQARAEFLRLPLTNLAQIRPQDAFLFGAIITLMIDISGTISGSLLDITGRPKIDIDNPSKAISGEGLYFSVLAKIPFAISTYIAALNGMQLLITCIIASWLKEYKLKRVVALLPIAMVYSLMGGVIALALSPSTLMGEISKEDLYGSIDKAFVAPFYILISGIFFILLLNIILPWMKGERKPNFFHPFMVILNILILNHAVSYSTFFFAIMKPEEFENNFGAEFQALPALTGNFITGILLFGLTVFVYWLCQRYKFRKSSLKNRSDWFLR